LKLTLSEVFGLVTVTELDSLVNTSGSTGGDSGTEETYRMHSASAIELLSARILKWKFTLLGNNVDYQQRKGQRSFARAREYVCDSPSTVGFPRESQIYRTR